VAPAPNPPALSATSNIPNIGGLVQNMNDLSARTNLDAGSHDSSNYSGDPPDSLMPAWPANSGLPRIKKLSWDDDDDRVIAPRINRRFRRFLESVDRLRKITLDRNWRIYRFSDRGQRRSRGGNAERRQSSWQRETESHRVFLTIDRFGRQPFRPRTISWFDTGILCEWTLLLCIVTRGVTLRVYSVHGTSVLSCAA